MGDQSTLDITLNTVLDTVLDGVIMIDARGIILSFNKAAVSIFGYEPEEVTGRNVKILMPEPYHSEHDGYIANYHRSGEKKVIGIGREVTGRRKDGSIFPMELGINEMKAGNERMFVGTVRDITERKQSEEDNNCLMSKLFDSNSELERFAYVASHDLQEPIRMINNFSKILLSEYRNTLDLEGKEYLSMVTESGERMRDMVSDLLEYSRMTNDTVNFSQFDSRQALESAMENLKALIEEQGAIIHHDRLPVIYGNPVQIMRLLQNLITNAIKYQPRGNRPEIHITTEDAGEHWKIHVKDNGLGIDNQFLKHIFEPFRRLHSWDSVKGSGLGLSICKKIVEHNQGKLSVTSTPGVGSIFTITLPKPKP